jgi:hypothetical protein
MMHGGYNAEVHINKGNQGIQLKLMPLNPSFYYITKYFITISSFGRYKFEIFFV